MRDLVTSQIASRPAWNLGKCLKAVAEHGSGVIVILSRAERPEQLLDSIDMVLGETPPAGGRPQETYTSVGLGSQILKDLGVGKIHLMGAPIKYNAISGFDLEVLDFVDPTQSLQG
jgi:3,4-dihydroxy 2-butanone 4-phosphate synthase/GTP cyclohydrolase II